MSTQAAPTAFADLPDAVALRRLVGQLLQHTLKHLDVYLQELAEATTTQGGRVHLVAGVAAARSVFEKILAEKGHPSVLLQDAPLCQEMIRALQASRFERGDGEGGLVVLSPEWAVAETGQICLVDDGDSQKLPEAIVAVMWLDQIVPRLADVGVLLKWVSRQALGRAMPPLVRLVGGDFPSLDLILVGRAVKTTWVARLLRRLGRSRTPLPTEQDWLASLTNSLTQPKRLDFWERRS